MKRHLTEDELIQHLFELTPDASQSEFAAHLKDCSDCRERLEKLRRRFASLDLLAGDIELSEELISKVLAVAEEPPARSQWFRLPVWIGSAAAVLVVAALFMVSSEQRVPEPSSVATRFAEEESEHADRDIERERKVLAEKEFSAGELAAKPPAARLAREAAVSQGGGPALRRIAAGAAGQMPEKPPFAPASAIELVTLPRRDNVQITIYNSADLTLVRERRNLTLKKGWNWLQLMWANTFIDPTSLTLEPKAHADKIDIQQLVFPPRLRELGRWLIRSEIEGRVPFEVTYFTSGLRWRAFYMGTLSPDETKMDLKGYVRVDNNCGEDYENAQTRLLVGKVHLLDEIAELARRRYPYGRPALGGGFGDRLYFGKGGMDAVGRRAGIFDMAADVLGEEIRRKEIRKEGLSEYFLYTIEGTETIANQWGKRLLSLDVNGIDVESLYKYDEDRYGSRTVRFLSFANDEDHNLGQTPLPNGSVRIFGRTADEHLRYLGGTAVKYIPVNEEVELNLGPARLVKVEPILMDYKTTNYTFDRRGNIDGWDEIRTWKIKITNTRELPVELEITRGFGTTYWELMLEADPEVTYEKHDATHARFKTTVSPRSKRAFTYTVTTYHGRREETFSRTKNREPGCFKESRL